MPAAKLIAKKPPAVEKALVDMSCELPQAALDLLDAACAERHRRENRRCARRVMISDLVLSHLQFPLPHVPPPQLAGKPVYRRVQLEVTPRIRSFVDARLHERVAYDEGRPCPVGTILAEMILEHLGYLRRDSVRKAREKKAS